jgi:hypothetical protein
MELLPEQLEQVQALQPLRLQGLQLLGPQEREPLLVLLLVQIPWMHLLLQLQLRKQCRSQRCYIFS